MPWASLLPELFLAGAAVLFLIVDGKKSAASRDFWSVFTGLALGVGGFLVYRPIDGTVFGAYMIDPLARFFKFLILLGVLLVVFFVNDHGGFRQEAAGIPWGTFAALLLLATV